MGVVKIQRHYESENGNSMEIYYSTKIYTLMLKVVHKKFLLAHIQLPFQLLEF